MAELGSRGAEPKRRLSRDYGREYPGALGEIEN